MSANGAYTRARLTQDTDPLVGGRKGDRLPYTPSVSVSVNADYEWILSGETTAFVGSSLRFLAKQSAEFSPTFVAATGRQRQIPSYVVADARAGVDFGRFSVELYAKNLSNSQGKTSTSADNVYPLGSIGAGIIRPRTFGIALGAGI